MAETSPLDTLAECWVLWGGALVELEPDQWAAPTRLGTWDVRSLVTHHAGWLLGFTQIADKVVAEAAELTTAVDLLRRFNEPGGVATEYAGDIERQTREHAATVPTDQLVATFATTAPEAIAVAREVGIDTAIDYVGVATMTVGEVARIGVLEATVHGLDLLRAVGAPVERVPASAQEAVADLLVALPGRLAFIEGATGRRPLFPVLR
jgi:uncharacterized protein (TIGR03083 family)